MAKISPKNFFGIVSLSFLAILLAVTVVTLGKVQDISPNAANATCKPRPACLDSTPRCLIAEPVGGWCPTSSIHPFQTKKPAATSVPILRTVSPLGTPVRDY